MSNKKDRKDPNELNDVLKQLGEYTFAVQHNPACQNPYLVRMVGKDQGYIDMKAYFVFRPLLVPGESQKDPDPNLLTKDILGFGKTLQEAGKEALKQRSKIMEE